MESSLNVEYIGTKDRKADNVAGTGVVWLGHGDVQSVPASAWPKLSYHPGVWRLAVDEIEMPKDGLGLGDVGNDVGDDGKKKFSVRVGDDEVDMTGMDDEAVRAVCKSIGISHNNRKGDRLKQAVVDYVEARA